MLQERTKEDLERELSLWKRLSKLQDRLLAAYKTGKHPTEATLDQVNKVRTAPAPYIEAAALRADKN